MPRAMSSEMLAAVQASELRPAFFVALQFASGWAYVWSGVGSVSWNGQTWLGVGTLGTASVIEEGSNVAARGVTLTLSGIDSSMLADALQEIKIGLPVLIYLALFDSSNALIGSPLTSWAGRIDQPTIEVGGDTASISIACENRALEMNVAVDRRYTQDDSEIDTPGDLGFMFVSAIQAHTIYFGATPNGHNL